MALAVAGSAAACKKETNSLPNNVFTVAPGECEEILEDNIRICNRSGKTIHNNYVYVRIDILKDHEWSNIYDSKLNEATVYKMEGILEGLAFGLGSGKNILFSIDEPLLSATPAPTPLPTPFRMEPMEDPSTL